MTDFVFEPPLAPLDPPFLPESDPGQIDLWRHYRPRMVGTNVFLLNNGHYVQTNATPNLVTPIPSHTQIANTTSPVYAMTQIAAHMSSGPQPPWAPSEALLTVNVPYPWNPYTPNAPYVHIQQWTGGTQTVTLTPRIEQYWYGGHRNTIDEATAAGLIAAGYGTCISPVGTWVGT